jgi:hypothetical protein
LEIDLTGQGKIGEANLRTEVLVVEASTSATWKASTPEVYSYLRELNQLLPELPRLQGLKIASQSGSARILMGIPILGKTLNYAIDIKAEYDPEKGLIVLNSFPELQKQLFGPCPEGYTPANFRADIFVTDGRAGECRVKATIRLGLTEWPKVLRVFAGTVFSKMAYPLAKEQVQKIIDELVARLQKSYTKNRRA